MPARSGKRTAAAAAAAAAATGMITCKVSQPHTRLQSFGLSMLDGIGSALGTVLVYGLLVVAAVFAIRHAAKKSKKDAADGKDDVSLDAALRSIVKLRSSGGGGAVLLDNTGWGGAGSGSSQAAKA
jgi:hypothetical protein